VPKWIHERERLLVGIEHQHAGGERQAVGDISRDHHVDESYLPRGKAGQRLVEMVPLRPERPEALLPDGDDLGWLDLGTIQTYPKGFLPHLAEALQGTRCAASFYIQIERARRSSRHLQRRRVLRPGGRIAWSVLDG
jgi:hypothetical protein